MGLNLSRLPSDIGLWSEHTIEITTPGYKHLNMRSIAEKLTWMESPHARWGHSVASSGSGEMFIFGGAERNINSKLYNDTWVIRVSGDSESSLAYKDYRKGTKLEVSKLTTTGEAPSPRLRHQSVVANGQLLVWGGHFNDKSSTLADNAIYSLNLSTHRWTKLDIQPAPSARYRHAVCLCGNKFIVFGGRTSKTRTVNDLWSLDVELLEQDNPTWERIEIATGSPSPTPRLRPQMAAYQNQLYIIGGEVGDSRTSKRFIEMWGFNMVTRVWAKVAFPEKIPASSYFKVQLVGDALYVFDGLPGHQISWIYKIPEQKWYRFPELHHRPWVGKWYVMSTIGEYVFLAVGLNPNKGGSLKTPMTVHGLNTGKSGYPFESGLIDFPKWGRKTTVKPIPTTPLLQVARASTAPLPQDAITGAMSATTIMRHLVAHGCRDVSADLNISHVSEYPVSSGGSGDVYLAILRNGDRVGVKCMRMLVGSTDEGRKFLKHAAHELYVWSKCKHPCILELFGVTIFRDQIAMVSPWVENGHMRWFLSLHPQANRCALCVRIADGVDYLHQHGTVHGDLKPENILIEKDHAPKLTDFGSAALSEYTLQFAHSNTLPNITMRWTAPEILSEESKATPAGDVYALGMIIYEAITGMLPYGAVKDAVILCKILAGQVPRRPETHIPSGVEQADRLWSLITRCWAFDPLARPTAWEVRDIMAGITPGGLLANRI